MKLQKRIAREVKKGTRYPEFPFDLLAMERKNYCLINRFVSMALPLSMAIM